MIAKGEFCNIPEVLLHYRIHASSVSKTRVAAQQASAAQAIFPDILVRLEQVADVQSNQEDHLWNAEDLKAAMANKDAAIVTGGERVDADILKASPQLKIVSNIAVGYNNFDMAAFSAANVMATNTPDVLTDTTADFGFALLMATARRVTESEHWLRAGNWKKFSIYDTPLSVDIRHINCWSFRHSATTCNPTIIDSSLFFLCTHRTTDCEFTSCAFLEVSGGL